MFTMHFSVCIQLCTETGYKSSVTHQLLKMTVYPEDMCLDMGNEKTTQEETTSSISYNEMKQSEIEP